jgi:hypothetical protein
MKKTLKSIKSKYGMLNEAYAWERTPGKALPTLADVQAKYNAKSVNEQEANKRLMNEGEALGDITEFKNGDTGQYTVKVSNGGRDIGLYLDGTLILFRDGKYVGL